MYYLLKYLRPNREVIRFAETVQNGKKPAHTHNGALWYAGCYTHHSIRHVPDIRISAENHRSINRIQSPACGRHDRAGHTRPVDARQMVRQ